MDEEKEYFIAFYTKDCPEGTIDCVKVELSMFRQRNMNTPMAVNLCEHPLYFELERYVKANPSNGRPTH